MNADECSVSEPLLWNIHLIPRLLLFFKFKIWPKNWVLVSYPVSLPIFFFLLHMLILCFSSRMSFFSPFTSSLALVLSDYISLPPPLSHSSSCHGNWLRKIMQTYLALSEISVCLAHARLIAKRSGAALVVRLVELTLKQTRRVVVFEPRPLRAVSLCLSASLSLSVRLLLLFSFCLSYTPYCLPRLCPQWEFCLWRCTVQLGIEWSLVWQGWSRPI